MIPSPHGQQQTLSRRVCACVRAWLAGPKTIQVANVSINEMPLYHRHGGMVVTAIPGQNAAATNFSTLVVQCWPHSAGGLGTFAAARGALASRRTFHDSSTGADDARRYDLELVEAPRSVAAAADGCALRDVALTITPASVAMVAEHPARVWVARVHLTAGDTVQSLASLASGAAMPYTLHETKAAAVRAGWRVQESVLPGFTLGASTLGRVVEVVVEVEVGLARPGGLNLTLRSC